jgi:ferritin-like metal-binding protein YciE
MEEYAASNALDAGLLAGGSGGRALRNVALWHAEDLAAQLGMNDAAALLDQTLQEEKKTYALLGKLAQAKANLKAA